MTIILGCHVEPTDPVTDAIARGAQLAQITLGDPQRWTDPVVAYPGGAAALRDAAAAAGIALVVHSAYLINVVSTNNRVRVPSRNLLQKTLLTAAEIGAIGVVVHGGHVSSADEVEVGYDNWFKVADRLELPVPMFIENTAGGANAMARTLAGWQRLWTSVSAARGAAQVGVCLDTCHAFTAGLDLATVVASLTAITGRIDLVHANDSRDPADTGADRHANLGAGKIPAGAIAAVVREADVPTVIETPGGVEQQTADLRWLRAALD